MPAQVLFDQLLTEDLSGVTFVRDYIQLQFNPPPQINVYSKCSVVRADTRATFGDPEFANLLIGCIGLKVLGVRDDKASEVITIDLEQQCCLELPYAEGTYKGPEALDFQGRDQAWGVWPG